MHEAIVAAVDVYFMRSAPMLLSGCMSRHNSKSSRAIAIAALGLVLLVCSGHRTFIATISAYAYFVGVVLLLSAMLRLGWLQERTQFTTLARLGLSFGLGLFLPGFLVDPGPRVIFMVLGWEFAFSCYSYSAEATASPERSVKDAIWFCLVDPNLVFTDRARFQESRSGDYLRQWLFCGAWLILLALSFFIDGVMRRMSRVAHLTAVGVFQAIIYYSVLTVLFCTKQIAVTGSQLSLLRAQGYSISERYVRPFSAVAPREFWDRWNTYLRSWLWRYAIVPTWRAYYGIGQRRNRWAQRGGILGVFLAVGFLHDVVVALRDNGWRPFFLVIFALHGVLLVAWPAAAIRGFKMRRLCWIGFWALTVAIGAVAMRIAERT